MGDRIFALVTYVVMLPIVIVVCVMMMNETKPKKNITLGVTLPFTASGDPEVREACDRYRRSMRLWCVLLCLVGLVLFIPRAFSVVLTLSIFWMQAMLVVPMVLYVRTHRRLKAIKRSRGWFLRRQDSEITVDITAAARPRKRMSGWWFVPPLIVSLVPVALAALRQPDAQTAGWLILGLSMTGMVLMSMALYPVIFRLRADVAGSDSRVNEALSNVRRANWGRTWIYLSWATSLCAMASYLLRNSNGALITINILYTSCLLALCVWTEMDTRRVQERLTEGLDAGYVDEDRYWIWGMLYNNPNDRHLTANARVGMNMSFNLARPAGKVIMLVCALLVALMPLFGVWTMLLEFSPREAELTDGVTVTHVSECFSVDYDQIDEALLLTELPHTSRLNGTSMTALLEGIFSVEGYGRCEISLDPREAPFVVLDTSEGTYVFNLETPQETEDVFDMIRSELNAEN